MKRYKNINFFGLIGFFTLAIFLFSCEGEGVISEPNPKTVVPEDHGSDHDQNDSENFTIEELIERGKVDPEVAIKPQRIEIDLHQGHSHAGEAQNPVGSLFWASTDDGFHANPSFEEDRFPIAVKQSLVYELQEDGSYKITSPRKIFYTEASPIGNKTMLTALVVRLYDAEGRRLDLDLRSKYKRDRVQTFYVPTHIRPSREGVEIQEGLEKYPAFSYMYFDRETDDLRTSPNILRTPIGFRGVAVQCQAYVRYEVAMLLTVMHDGEGKPKPYALSNEPTKHQLEHLALKIEIPFENVAWRFGSILEDASKLDFDAYNAASEAAEERFFEDVKAIAPEFSIEELKKIYEARYELSPEGSSFWL